MAPEDPEQSFGNEEDSRPFDVEGDDAGDRSPGGGPPRPAARELTYAQASARLDAIVEQLDQGTVDVDELDTLFSEAIEIVEELDRRLRRARTRVEELAPRLDALVHGAEARPPRPEDSAEEPF